MSKGYTAKRIKTLTFSINEPYDDIVNEFMDSVEVISVFIDSHTHISVIAGNGSTKKINFIIHYKEYIMEG